MKHTAIAAALLSATAVAGAPAAQAQNMNNNQNQNYQNQNAQNQNAQNRGMSNNALLSANPQGPAISVMPAASIMGRPVVGSHGRDAGRVFSMIIDTKNAAVEYLLIAGARGFNLNGQVVAVPWSAVRPRGARGAVQLSVTAHQVANAPAINRNEIYQLATPAWRDRVYGYYGYPFGYRYGYGGYAGDGYGYGARGVHGRAGGPCYGATGAFGSNCGYRPPQGAAAGNYNGGNNAQSGNQTANNNAANGQQNRNSGGTSGGQTANAGNGQNRKGGSLSVSQSGVMSIMANRSEVSPRGFRQANVYAQSGNLIGNVDQVMIDTGSGRVAFVLIKRGGFLGLNPTWYAVPVQALNWRPYRQGYRLQINEQALRGLPMLPAINANLTTDVPRGELARLYQKFNVQPYWQRQNGSSQQNGSQQNG